MSISPATQATSINPANGHVISSLPWATAHEIEECLQQAVTGYAQWKQTTVAWRAQKLRDLG